MIKLAAFVGENQHIGEHRCVNSGYIICRFETEENTIRSIGTHVILLRIFPGNFRRIRSLGKFRACTMRCYSRRKLRNSQTERWQLAQCAWIHCRKTRLNADSHQWKKKKKKYDRDARDDRQFVNLVWYSGPLKLHNSSRLLL